MNIVITNKAFRPYYLPANDNVFPKLTVEEIKVQGRWYVHAHNSMFEIVYTPDEAEDMAHDLTAVNGYDTDAHALQLSARKCRRFGGAA
ncbi:MAG: hypothetical protein JKX72_09410 [Robiginitomaculum sp.]|nr:hypothetical protein [Robiginitomaculum sp.]